MTSEALEPGSRPTDAGYGASVDRLRRTLHRPMLIHAQSFVRDWKEADVITKAAFAQLSAALASGESIVDADTWLRMRIQEAAFRHCSLRPAEANREEKKFPTPAAEPTSREAQIQELEKELVLSTKRVCASKEFNRLFSEYAVLRQRTLEAIARRITQSPHSAQDVVQEAFIALHGRLSNERAAVEVGPWLTRVVVNLAINHTRKQRTRRAMPLDAQDVASGQASPEERCSVAEMTAQMWESVAGLPMIQRRIVELRALEGMDYAAIGAALSISATAARQQHYRTVVRLREALSSEGKV